MILLNIYYKNKSKIFNNNKLLNQKMLKVNLIHNKK